MDSMEDPAVTDRKIKRLRALTADIDNVYFNIKSERTPVSRRCSRSATAAWRLRSPLPNRTARTGAPLSPTRASTATSTSS